MYCIKYNSHSIIWDYWGSYQRSISPVLLCRICQYISITQDTNTSNKKFITFKIKNMKNTNLAPIILFVYARPIHTQRTIDALLLNSEALLSDLIVYSDGPKTETDENAVNQVRNIIKNLNGFKSVKLIERIQNNGLAKNIIDGVSEVLKNIKKL
ncbi:glycosyltransferase [Providencia stuartii MRSN 2154]|uniref:Glycosyltransferase n=2 Tax=Providencia stuartii TaxID=588 RepID=A0A140NME8_PROSM|nr:hypothetical protein [Providencia stuartii]AFH93122.1 glycosyltransferase [Providencia stuartii MRSN 2154]